MRIIPFISIVFFALWSLTSKGQSYYCTGSEPLAQYKVTFKDGAPLLADWNDSTAAIGTIPYETVLTVCDEMTYGSYHTAMKVFYGDTTGFVRKDLISPQEKINMVILNRWMGDVFPPADKYYGLFDRDNINPHKKSSIELCETKVDSFLTDDNLGYLSSFPNNRRLASVLLQSDKPKIMISGIKIKTGTDNRGVFYDGKFLYPGESVVWHNGQETYYSIYAMGEVEENKDTTTLEAFSRIKNYEFHVRRKMNGKIEDKILYRTEFHSWNAFQYEGGIFVHWIGDIDGDGLLDLVLTISHHYACWEVVFLLSTKSEPGYFFKEVVKYTECSC